MATGVICTLPLPHFFFVWDKPRGLNCFSTKFAAQLFVSIEPESLFLTLVFRPKSLILHFRY